MPVYKKFKSLYRELVTETKSPFKFFVYWSLFSLTGIDWDMMIEYDVNAVNQFELFTSTFFNFLFIWFFVTVYFRSSELRFWAVSRYLTKGQSLKLDIEKIKNKHLEHPDAICFVLFVFIFIFILRIGSGVFDV